LGLLVLLSRCAQVVPLSGGAKDVSPPKLVEASPALSSTSFTASKIILEFDEYVQVRDLTNQLIINPKIKTTPEITAVGKKVIVSLVQKELLPNTTYRFSFGNSIADMNESNPISNFEYVFSTGKSIDTLQLSGTITNAFDNEPVSGAVVGLYYPQERNDSIPYIYTPDYLTLTTDNGQFSFKNLPKKRFAIYTFTDKNKNRLYETQAEKIGFLDKELQLESDSSIDLCIFQEEQEKVFIKKSVSPFYGFAQIILNKKSQFSVKSLHEKDSENVRDINQNVLRDTISIFYKSLYDTLNLILEQAPKKQKDTLRMSIPKIRSGKTTFMPFNTILPNTSPQQNDSIKLKFFNWMDTSKVERLMTHLLEQVDSLPTNKAFKGYWRTIDEFVLSTHLKPGTPYILKIDSGAFTNMHGNSNDSVKVTFKTKTKEEFGKVTLKVKLNKKQSYIIQLLNDQMKIVQQRIISFSLSSSNAVTIDFTNIPPGSYKVKIIFDDNENQKWDSGELNAKRQPEKVIINSKQLKIVADWEIEEEIFEKDGK